MVSKSGGVVLIVVMTLAIIVMVITMGSIRIIGLMQTTICGREEMYRHYYATYGLFTYVKAWWKEVQAVPVLHKRYEKNGFVCTMPHTFAQGQKQCVSCVEITSGTKQDIITIRLMEGKKIICCLTQDIKK